MCIKVFRSVAVLSLASLLLFQTGCSSNDEKADVEAAQADVESLEEGGAAVDEALLSDQLPEDALGGESAPAEASSSETAATDTGTQTDAASGDMAASEGSPESLTEPAAPTESTESTEPAMDSTASSDASADDLLAGSDDSTGMAATDSSSPAEPPPMVSDPAPTTTEPSADMSASSMGSDSSSSATTETASSTEEAPVKKVIPLQKVADRPWKVGGKWLNTVYFARPGDNLKKISQNIYGEDRTSALKAGNPTYKARDTRPGDKIYYNSPKRPDDGERVLTYHEDNGITPESYTAKAGDNIRTVAKNLLGYGEAWKEVWASNTVESKGEIPEGTELRYWSAAPTNPNAGMMNAENTAPPEMPAAPPSEVPPAQAQAPDSSGMDIPPPPSQDMAGDFPPPPPPPSDATMNDLPPPPPPVSPESGMAGNDLPPPPPVDDASMPPPPPPPVAASTEEGGESPGNEMAFDEDTMMTLGVAAFAALALVGLIIVRKKRKQKELEAGIGDHAS